MAAARPTLRIMMTADAVGGVWTYATSLACGLAQRGHEIVLVTLGPAPRLDQLQAVRHRDRLSIRVTDHPLEWMEPQGETLARTLAGLEAIAREVRPDVVHLNGFREAQGTYLAPIVIGAHSCVRSWWRACRGGEPDEAGWASYAGNVAAGLDAADAWVAPTKAFGETITTLYQPRRSGKVIRNGVRLQGRQLAKQPFILAAGRLWDEAKNIGALAAVAGRLPWPLRVAGAAQAPDGAGPRHACEDDVTFLGELPSARLLAEMCAAEIFVAPALYEPFGLTIAEAAACSCALVLADLPTLRELWDGAALFVDPRDPDALAAAIVRLSRELGLRRQLRQAARRRAADYSLPAMLDAYEALYQTLAFAHSGGGRSPHLYPAEASR